MNALRILNRSIGIAGVLVVCFTFYMSCEDPMPRMFSSFCADEQGRLYSVGGHHKRDLNGVLQECTAEGWANISAAACHQMNATVVADSQNALEQ